MKDVPIINVDVDGVLYNFTDAMRMEVISIMGIPPSDLPDPSQWSIHKEWPITGKQFHSLMYDGIAQGRTFRRGELIGGRGTTQALKLIQGLGWHVRIVTSKTFSDPFITMQARKNTLTWLYDNEVPHDTLAFSDSTVGKRSYRADAIVDDKPSIEWMQFGSDNFLFDQAWNRNVDTDDISINRISDLHEIYKILKGDPA